MSATLAPSEFQISPLLSNSLKKSDASLIHSRQRITINADRPAYTGSNQSTIQVELGLGRGQFLDAANSYLSFNFLPTTVGSTAAATGLTCTNTAKLFQNIKLYSKSGTLLYDSNQYHSIQSSVLMTNACAQDWLNTAGQIYGLAEKTPSQYNYGATAANYSPWATVDSAGNQLNNGVVTQVNALGTYFTEKLANDAMQQLNFVTNAAGVQLEFSLATIPILGQIVEALPFHVFPLTMKMQLNNPSDALNYIGVNTPTSLSPVTLSGANATVFAPGTTAFPTAAIVNPEFILSNVLFSASVINMSEGYITACEARMDRGEYAISYTNWFAGLQNIPQGTSNTSVQIRKPVANAEDIYWCMVDTNTQNNLAWDSTYFNGASNIKNYQYIIANQPVPALPYSNYVDMYNANRESFNMLHDTRYKAQSLTQWTANATYGQNIARDLSSSLTGVDTRSSQVIYLNVNFNNPTPNPSNLYYFLSHDVVMRIFKDGTIRFSEGYEPL